MIEEEKFIIDINEGKGSISSAGNIKFPVKTQFAIVVFILLLLFAGYVIPKITNVLDTNHNQAEVAATTDPNNNTSITTATEIKNIDIKARSAFVWDVVGQRALFQKNEVEILPLASITKLMTALVAYELVPDNRLVTISKAAAAQQSGGDLKAGEVFEVKELADFALVSSYNSAAYTLANSVGTLLGEGDPVTQFVAAMNIKAKELDLESLSFTNPTGLDVSTIKAGAYGNAREVSLLVEYIVLNYPEILTPTVTEHAILYNQNGERHESDNTNNILTDIPNLLGSKTGYTDLAGGNLTIVYDAGFNRPIIITVLGSTWSERFSDVKKILAAIQKEMSNNI